MYRSERYLALVRKLPCAQCGRKPVQAAHSNLLIHGKGKSIKASDAATFPLCDDCHREFDQGGVESEEAEALTHQWIAQTHIQLVETGLLKF
ncbi:DUF968 domain-containing protein [Burkholderia sp. Ac-20349]|uniref:DUF968 domain-containing protein n=1 Tax=Burkholderia sp. Ac-20349 TaxID=2703893 RepID=UPI00197BB11D|nr:DUF968 domain-containing protein [Burkholderia sp. Ac-20349]HDR9165928.1 DUF968 domain-containing protein [Burkholderia vietnamiensis]